MQKRVTIKNLGPKYVYLGISYKYSSTELPSSHEANDDCELVLKKRKSPGSCILHVCDMRNLPRYAFQLRYCRF